MEWARLFFQTHERTPAHLRGVDVTAVVTAEGFLPDKTVQVHVPAGELPGVREMQDLNRRWI
jgi:hypothetical protein